MWRPWSRALELLGRVRLGGPGRTKQLRVGHPGSYDAQGGWRWKEFVASEKLFDVWGPAPDGPWPPFHCVPLFAALDRIRRDDIGPTPTADRLEGAPPARAYELPAHARWGAPPPRWIAPDTMTIVDLPGPASVEAAAWLVSAAGCQPVCTFDNWPHPKGVLRVEQTLAELLRWASAIADARHAITPASPPLWICDSERLGTRSGSPGEFDNRYYLDDSILPGLGLLRRSGITRVVYLTPGAPGDDGEGDVPRLDLEPFFAELLAAGMPVLHVALGDPALEPVALASPSRRRKLRHSGYRRSAAGGFGTEVPQPSSSSSGGGG
jgi:hypothetical protein